MRQLLCNAQLIDPEATAASGDALLIEGGRILDRLPAAASRPASAAVIDLAGRRLAPGFVDLHLHDALIYSPPERLGDDLRHCAKALVSQGTTAFLATTIAWSVDRIDAFMTRVGEFMTHPPSSAASLLGVHLEGPWIAHDAAGAQPEDAIRPYDAREDAPLLENWSEHLRMVSLAPEIAGSEALLERLRELRIAAALGHSRASSERIDAACQLGMTHVTHLFNAMGPLHHRRPGVAATVLMEPRLSCDLICDGAHVHPGMVRLAAALLGDRLNLITDRIAPPAGAAASFGSGAVHDDGTALRLPDGTLAGSTLTMDAAVRNLRRFAAVDEIEAVAAASFRPARVLGIESERGSLRVGARADFVVLGPDLEVEETWIGGQPVYRASDAATARSPELA